MTTSPESPLSLWLASPARKHVLMLVNYEVPTSSYASESEDISREIGALRRACISLASIPPKQAQRDPAPFIGVIIPIIFLRRRMG